MIARALTVLHLLAMAAAAGILISFALAFSLTGEPGAARVMAGAAIVTAYAGYLHRRLDAIAQESER